MAFFVGDAWVFHQMVAGVKEGQSKRGNAYVELTVLDDDGNVNKYASSEVSNMTAIRSLVKGDYVDLRLVLAGGPSKQYAMVSRKPNSVRVSDGIESTFA